MNSVSKIPRNNECTDRCMLCHPRFPRVGHGIEKCHLQETRLQTHKKRLTTARATKKPERGERFDYRPQTPPSLPQPRTSNARASSPSTQSFHLLLLRLIISVSGCHGILRQKVGGAGGGELDGEGARGGGESDAGKKITAEGILRPTFLG